MQWNIIHAGHWNGGRFATNYEINDVREGLFAGLEIHPSIYRIEFDPDSNFDGYYRYYGKSFHDDFDPDREETSDGTADKDAVFRRAQREHAPSFPGGVGKVGLV